MSSESKSLVKLQRLSLLMSDSDMEAAAQQLLQLSDEDNSSSSSSSSNSGNGVNNKKKKKLKLKMRLFEERKSQDEITSAKIEEIFGKDEEEEILRLRPIKKQKYRFLESIYKETKPIY